MILLSPQNELYERQQVRVRLKTCTVQNKSQLCQKQVHYTVHVATTIRYGERTDRDH